MRFAFIGGDMRTVSLAQSIAGDGHDISCFALENSGAFASHQLASDPESCTRGADCVVLPLPVLDIRGNLNAPLSCGIHNAEAVLRSLPQGVPVCGGKPEAWVTALAEELGLDFTDYFIREELVALNALATAEGAISLILRSSPRTIWDSRVLVVGFGRIGRMLAQRLRDMGAHVTVSARKAGDMAYIRAMGCTAMDTRALGHEMGDFDTIVNTVPAPVLGRRQLEFMKAGALCLDLASRPGGVDFEAARELGRNVIWALGLPAETAPETAGRIIKETVMNILKEKQGEF